MEIAKEIERYKGGRTLPNVEEFNKEYEVKKHQIFTNVLRYPDRIAESSEIDETGNKITKTKLIPLNRIGLPYQKKIVNIATTFFCGEPIKYTNNLEEADLYDAFIKVIEKNKMKFIDKEIVTAVGRFTECAELWYPIKESNEHYGFQSDFRLKVKILTPDKYNLYPVFNEYDELVSFAREFKNDKKDIFEVYTEDKIIRYERESHWEKVVSPL